MIWFIILKAGLVVGTIGPSPMTIDQCHEFAVEKTREFERAIATGLNINGEKISSTDMVEIKKFSFTCVDQPYRPKHNEALKVKQHDK